MKGDEWDFYAAFLRELDAVRSGCGAAPALPAQRVYVNTGLLASREALQANYPRLGQLLGADAFELLATAYARANPPHDARLFLYGAGLPAMLAASEGESSLVATVARLDRYWTEAQAEADAPLLSTRWIAQQGGAALETLHLRPAPATRWLAHADLPLWDWWQALREPASDTATPSGRGQAVLLTRPDDAVWIGPLPLAGAALLQCCDAGQALPDALQAAADVEPGADLQQVLADLFAVGAFQQPDQFIPKAF